GRSGIRSGSGHRVTVLRVPGRTPAPVDELGTADGMWMGGLIVGAAGSPAHRAGVVFTAQVLHILQTAAQ
ncbi:MAG: hypothetical protein M3Y35_02895, partial [Actinomycetota bacterium]|nr:hypothetical protein [Actinomycetota bacterium]